MPVGSVDNVVVSEEVLVVAWPPVWVGHHLVNGDVTLFMLNLLPQISRCCENRPENRKVWTWLVLAYAVANQRKKLSSGVGVCARGAQSRVMSNG